MGIFRGVRFLTFFYLRLIFGFWILRGHFLVLFFSFENFESCFGISGHNWRVCFLTFFDLRRNKPKIGHTHRCPEPSTNGNGGVVGGGGGGKCFLNCQIVRC